MWKTCRFLFQVIQNEVLSKETPKEEKTKKDDSDSSDEKPKKKTSDSHGPQIPRNLQHTPGTYPRPSTTCLWRKSFHICILGYLGYVPGVCWDFLRQMSSLFLFFSHLFRRRKLAILWGFGWFFESIFTVQKSQMGVSWNGGKSPFFNPKKWSFFVGKPPQWVGWGIFPTILGVSPKICMQVVGRCIFIRRTKIRGSDSDRKPKKKAAG